jgi:AcrR family transcriptional regulator
MTVNSSHIKKAALELFEKLSFAKTSVADIARACNLGKGTVYLYFRSKDDIFLSIAQDRLEALRVQDQPWFSDPKMPIDEKIKTFIALVVDEFSYMKDLLFGNYDDINGRMMRDVFLKVGNLHDWANALVCSLVRGATPRSREEDDELRMRATEFLDSVLGCMIYFVLGSDWNDKESMKALAVRRAPALFRAFVTESPTRT